MGTLGSLSTVEEIPKLVKHLDKTHYEFKTYIMSMKFPHRKEEVLCLLLKRERERYRSINLKSARIIHRLIGIKPLPLLSKLKNLQSPTPHDLCMSRFMLILSRAL
jgi:hypothetical protein